MAQVLEHLSNVEAGSRVCSPRPLMSPGPTAKAEGEAGLASGLLDLEPLLDRAGQRRVAGETSRPQGLLTTPPAR